MLRPLVNQVAQRLPAVSARRYGISALVAVIAFSLSGVIWLRAENDRRERMSQMLSSQADRSTLTMQAQIEREFDGLRGLSETWRQRETDLSSTLQFEAGRALDEYPGIRWIAWVTPDSTTMGFAGRDTSARMSDEVLHKALFQLSSPSTSIDQRWNGSCEFTMYLPVRSAGRHLGEIVGAISIDSVWANRRVGLGGFRSIRLIADDGTSVFIRKYADALAPEWMRVTRPLNSPTFGSMSIEWVPSDEFTEQFMIGWPSLFLLAGAVLSLALGGVVLLFLRLRDYSAALEQSNVELDARVNEFRELNEELGSRVNARTAELSRALRELETFNHSVSHDLRSPIGAIMNFAAVLQEDHGSSLQPEAVRFLDRIRQAASRANHLLDSLVEFARHERGERIISRINMRQLAERALAEAAGSDGGEVRVRLGDLPPAMGDPSMVYRVLINLIGNALKYSRIRETRELEVLGYQDESDNVYSVRDNGLGFDPALAGEVFTPFRRLHGTDVEGSGLGLAIVAKIIGRLGGRVWAESDGATGATFHFTLPRVQENGT